MRRVTVAQKRAASNPGRDAPDQRPWYWLLTRNRISGLEVFTQRTPEGVVILPVYSSAEDACAYLSDGRSSWKPRKTGRGELVSILMGVCREARWVTLDPPPRVATGDALELLGLSRESFLEALLGRGRSWFEVEHLRRRFGRRSYNPWQAVELAHPPSAHLAVDPTRVTLPAAWLQLRE
jgi:hypothetical protein